MALLSRPRTEEFSNIRLQDQTRYLFANALAIHGLSEGHPARRRVGKGVLFAGRVIGKHRAAIARHP